MAFKHASAPFGTREQEVLSADNIVPERHIIMNTLRTAAPLLGLKAPVIATLDAMLSCLPPKRSHNTVFASNATLAFRRNGISDRTIRRHVAILQEAGLLARCDSPNKKRFTKRDTHEGKALMFGFDLSLLFDRFQEIAAIAAKAMQQREQLDYLRMKLRAAANEALRTSPDNTHAQDILRNLRRNLTLAQVESLLHSLTESTRSDILPQDQVLADTPKTSGNDGQNVRHHHKAIKEHIDKIPNALPAPISTTESARTLSVTEVMATCTEAAQFALNKIRTFHDLIAHSRTMAPMLGIDSGNYAQAERHLGAVPTAITVMALMQMQTRIGKVGAYFRAITHGNKSGDFDPMRLIYRLRQQNLAEL
ncbi:plasmid replication protein RepC [Roseinatronobacter sp. NSM]|uniref:plasmid replication protein RepC n=1 Tax=Roseinatronobacter sp. NSM TaxID=3457785 RepID=UPI0040350170